MFRLSPFHERLVENAPVDGFYVAKTVIIRTRAVVNNVRVGGREYNTRSRTARQVRIAPGHNEIPVAVQEGARLDPVPVGMRPGYNHEVNRQQYE
mmetsp:Transcript_9157/g.11429  ORF Transcript_9157/g.11429 Transcript_9157/m.11429 type:complete len:95 (-) Transcript_9157:766-1050(-)